MILKRRLFAGALSVAVLVFTGDWDYAVRSAGKPTGLSGAWNQS